jgi:ABC-type transport system substrate-binding protein
MPVLRMAMRKGLERLQRPFREALTAVGLEVEFSLHGTADMIADRSGHVWFSNWLADYPDPDGFFRGLMQGTEWPFYEDDEIISLLDEARSIRNRGDRIRAYQEIDRLWVVERATILPLAYTRRLIARRPWVKGVRANPLSRVLLDEVVFDQEPATDLGPTPSAARRGSGTDRSFQ